MYSILFKCDNVYFFLRVLYAINNLIEKNKCLFKEKSIIFSQTFIINYIFFTSIDKSSVVRRIHTTGKEKVNIFRHSPSRRRFLASPADTHTDECPDTRKRHGKAAGAPYGTAPYSRFGRRRRRSQRRRRVTSKFRPPPPSAVADDFVYDTKYATHTHTHAHCQLRRNLLYFFSPLSLSLLSLSSKMFPSRYVIV